MEQELVMKQGLKKILVEWKPHLFSDRWSSIELKEKIIRVMIDQGTFFAEV